MEILLLVGLLVLASIYLVVASNRQNRAERPAHHAFYEEGYMREEVEALRTQTQEIPRID